MDPQVVRYSERPELWKSISDLSEEVWPEYNLHGDILNQYWEQLYDVFPQWQFVLYDAGNQAVLAEGHTIPLAWDGTDQGRLRLPGRPGHRVHRPGPRHRRVLGAQRLAHPPDRRRPAGLTAPRGRPASGTACLITARPGK